MDRTSDTDHFTIEEIAALARHALEQLHNRAPDLYLEALEPELPRYATLSTQHVPMASDFSPLAQGEVDFPVCPHCRAGLESVIRVEDATRRTFYYCEQWEDRRWDHRYTDKVRFNGVRYLCDECEGQIVLPDHWVVRSPRAQDDDGFDLEGD